MQRLSPPPFYPTTLIYVIHVYEPKTCRVPPALKIVMQNTVPVALKSGAIIGLAIQIGAPFRVPAPYAIGRKTPVFNLFQMLAGEVHGSVFQTITSLRATEASEVISHYIT